MAMHQPASNALTGVTLAGAGMGWLGWIETNSVALTVIIVFATGVGSLALNYWGKRCDIKIAKERNEIMRKANESKD